MLNSPEVSTVTVAALVSNGRIRLIDRLGNPMTGWLSSDRFGPLDDGVAHRVIWMDRLRRLAYSAGRHCAVADPWLKRVRSMVTSCRLRRLDRPSIGGRRHFDRYATSTWPEAVKRLVQQGHNHFRVRARTGWERWAYSASNNEKKRADAYERKRKHHG